MRESTVTLCLENIEDLLQDTFPTAGKARLATFREKAEQYVEVERAHAPGLTPREANVNAINALVKDLQEAHATKEHQRKLNALRKKELQDFVNEGYAGNPWKGFWARLNGDVSPGFNAGTSVKAIQNALTQDYQSRLHNMLDAADLKEHFESQGMDADIAHEMWNLDTDAPIRHQNARKIAEIIREVQDAAVTDANRAGARIKRISSYVVRQSHDMYRVAKVSAETWMGDIAPRLDWKQIEKGVGRVMDADDRVEFLEDIYGSLRTGAFHRDANSNGFVSGANIGKKLSQERVLHFASGDDWFAYHEKYGLGSVQQGVLFGLDRLAEGTGMMQVLGPNAKLNLDDAYLKVQEKKVAGKNVYTHDQRAFMNKKKHKIDMLMLHLDGSARAPVNVTFARWASVTRAIESMSKLGSAFFSAAPTDPILIASELRHNGQSILGAYASTLKFAFPGVSASARRRVQHSIGIAHDAMRADLITRVNPDDSVPGAVAKGMALFFKYNLLAPWTDRMRSAAALALSNNLALHKDFTWKGLDADLKRNMRQYGIDQQQWDLLRKHAIIEEEGEQFMAKELVENIPDDEILAAAGNPKLVAKFKRDLRDGLLRYMVDRTEYAVIRPDAATSRLLLRGTRPGVAEGEIARSFAQFKGFPTAVLQKSVARELFIRGDFTKNKVSALKGLALFVLESTIMGYAAMSLKDLAKGREPKDPNDPATVAAALAQGGGLGIFGDFLFGEHTRNRYGGGALATSLGPVAGSVESALDLVVRTATQDKPAAAAAKFVQHHTPGANFFATRWATDAFMLRIVQEQLNPGYARDYENRIRNDGVQTLPWASTELFR